MKLIWSEYQKAIFNNVANGTGNLAVEAYAGSSKTTTLIESLKYIPRGKKILVVAFNKKIAEELRDKAPQYSTLDIYTLHSLGYKAVRTHFGKSVKLDPNKTENIIKSLFEKDGTLKTKNNKDNYELIYETKRAISLCKSFIIDVPSKIDELLDNFGIDPVEYNREEYIKKLIHILGKCKEDTSCVDFDDMVWFPFIYNLNVGQWDYVIIDETQDLNRSQFYLALSAAKKNGRTIIFFDKYQQIYAWRGADTDAINFFTTKLSAEKLPLPISYRCAQQVVYQAQKFVPGIKPAPNANVGKIISINEEELIDVIKPGDFLLSRVNAPLIRWCMKFLKLGIPANIQGKDISVGLIFLIKQSQKRTVKSFLEWLDIYEKKEIGRLKEKNRDTSILQDKLECLRSIAEDASSTDELKKRIKELFIDGDDAKRIILGSVHAVKGAERNRVFVLYNTLKEDSQEEKNIKYVAITRAKNELYYVHK